VAQSSLLYPAQAIDGTMTAACFSHFIEPIVGTEVDTISNPQSIPAAFLLARGKTPNDKTLSIHYTPFDYVNTSARVVVVGITPGFAQWKNAVREARRQLALGAPLPDVLRAAKYNGAFSGAIRPNLVALLDHIGLQRWLGIASCATLWNVDAPLMHVTAVLRHAVFVDGKNYNGASPGMVGTPLLQAQMLDHFAREAAALPDAVYVPLGPKVGQALSWLATRGVLDEARILHGLPHPSGANAERIAYFLGRKEKTALSSRTNGGQIDADRLALGAKMGTLGLA
jgi:hypothetical protein